MCGIAGIVNWAGRFSAEELERVAVAMRDCMVHRGPDDAGVWVSGTGQCALAHRRLSIIDLSTGGRQPMSNEAADTWVTFNGELYNFHVLRDKLSADGHCFRTHTDSEVLPHLFEDVDPAHIRELDGMYAFGVWSERRNRLILARDPFGKKPLYYAEGQGWFAFASELQALRRVPGFDATLDREALSLYLLLQYVPAPLTIYRGAKKLLPGHYLELDVGSAGVAHIRTGLHADFRPRGSRGEVVGAQGLEQLRRLVIEAVEKRLEADVPLGAFLSGGVDSSLVAAVASKELGRTLKTFTIGFDGAADSEHLAAREIADHLGTEHYEKILKPDAVTLVDEIAARLDEPNGDSSCLPTLLLCQHAREHVTVALSGDGGDELFGGYGRYRDTLNESGNWKQRAMRRFGFGDNWSAAGAYLSPRWLIFQPEQVGRLMRGLPGDVGELLDGWRRLLDAPDVPLMHRMRDLDAHTYMPGAVLAKVDRMSMQVSLEVRCPLLDRAIGRFAEALGEGDCWQPPAQTKRLLKRLASDYLPAEWMHRRKLGFGLPANAWSKGEVLELANQRLLGKKGILRQHVDPDTLAELIAAQSWGKGFSIYQVWPLLILESWLEKNVA